MMGNLVIGVVLLGVLVYFHELGHFLAARLVGVKVLQFSLGFGKRLVGFTRGGTEYRVSALPLGGYVKMAGEETESEGSAESEEARETGGDPGLYFSKPWWARATIALGGPAMNLLVGFVAAVGVYLVGIQVQDFPPEIGAVPEVSVASQCGLKEGDTVAVLNGVPVASWWQMMKEWEKAVREESGVELKVLRAGDTISVAVEGQDASSLLGELKPAVPPVIGEVILGLPAYQAGLKEGDRITAISGVSISKWEDLERIIHSNAGKPLSFEVERKGKVFSTIITPQLRELEDGQKRGIVGITSKEDMSYEMDFTVPEAVVGGARMTLDMMKQVYAGLWVIVSHPGELRNSIAGPIGIVQMSGEQAKKGPDYLIWFGALLSVALMAFNLLPIPLLDGGHVVVFVAEGITGRPTGARTISIVQKVGLAIVATILVFSVMNDLYRIVQRKRALLEIDTVSVEQSDHAEEK